MCETPHRKTFADRSDLARPPPPHPCLPKAPPSLNPVCYWQVWSSSAAPVSSSDREESRKFPGTWDCFFFFFFFSLFFWKLQIKKDRRSSAFQQLPLLSDFSSSSQQTYTACLLRHLLFRNRLLGWRGSTLEQYLEQLAGRQGQKKLFKKKW